MSTRTHTVAGRILLTCGLAVTVSGVFFEAPTAAAEAPVGLGTAASFAVLGASTVTNTGPSVIDGDVGVSPGSATPGFGPATVTGVFHNADAVADQAQIDVTTAYNDAAGRATSASVGADLSGMTLVPGVYTGATLGLTQTVTLDAGGDPDAVFIFQAASTLITSSASVVALTNGASPCNVYWKVGSSATLGTNSVFVGTVLALESVTATTGARIAGRLFARTAAVTLDTNVITAPRCTVVPPSTSSSVASTSSSVASTSSSVASTSSSVASTSSSVASTSSSVGSTTSSSVAGSTTSSAPSTTSTLPAPSTSTVAPTSSSTIAAIVSTLAPTVRPTTTRAPTTTSSLAPLGADSGDANASGDVVTASTAEIGRATLPRTGTSLVVSLVVGILAVIMGGMLLVSGRRLRASR